jgi:eukaryotic-like serine/threonine-protein kinase
MRAHTILAERFLLESRLSHRPHASVWKAVDLRRGVLVALRVIEVVDASDVDAMRRAQRELQLTQGLRGRGLVRVLAWGQESHVAWIATEWVEGEDLRDWQRSVLPTGRGDEADRARVAALLGMYAAVARTMAYAHAAGVLHRDLSPSNVRISAASGRPVVIDFGLARASSVSDGTRLTRTLGMVGSPHYLSPEAVAGVPSTAQSDVFSLTAMLWEALSGTPPWQSSSVLDTALARLQGPPSWGSFGGRFPQSLAGVLEAGLSTAEADRPTGMRALCDLLLNVRDDVLGADPRRGTVRLRRLVWRVGWSDIVNALSR